MTFVVEPDPPTTPVEPTPVPTMTAWGLLALSPIMGLAGFLGFSRRRKV
ncbi:IPTL-CTERM sorting domain-containing protein [Comamonas sp. PR12]|uniref:IPTL-CTERM sorting domain-containing protein n=2 Tax=Comamonas TaxID=283 RepID=A0ABY6A1L2_9BURK|nr:IPTL-CTERM sorting domain-containing protein [Comamonas sp. PR12]